MESHRTCDQVLGLSAYRAGGGQQAPVGEMFRRKKHSNKKAAYPRGSEGHMSIISEQGPAAYLHCMVYGMY
jgi:hypothetical protein